MPLRFVILLLAGVLFFFLPFTVDFLTDWMWFGEVGYRDVYSTEITARATLAVAVFVAAAAWLTFHMRMALAALSPAPITFTTREGFTVALPTRNQLRPLVMIAVVVAAFLVASFASSQWMTVLNWWHQSPFGKVDPVLGHDASLYLFTLPVLELARGLVVGLVMLAAAGSAALYVAAGQMALTPFGVTVQDRARRHLTWLAAVFFLTLAVGAWLSRLNEIVAPSGIIQGASYADVHARMPAALVLMVAAVVAAGLAAASATSGSNRLLIAGAALYVLTMLGGEGYATMLQRFAVTPNEQVRETPFIEYNIAATREAFALDQVEERELPGEGTLTRADLEANRGTLDNVRLWDPQPLLDTFGQIQEIRAYYDFVPVDSLYVSIFSFTGNW